MFSIYCIIFLISIHGIISNNSSSNRLLIIPTCQVESISRTTSRHYYFYFSNSSSSSLSSSSSFLPLLHLSYCEHQQTTSYSSSGFSILYSLPRLPLTDIQDKKHSSSFHHHHNAVLSAVDQSSSTTSSNTIILMSPSSNENPILTTTGYSNLSVSTVIHQGGNEPLNIMLLTGCIMAGILLLIIIYIIVKYCNRDEGTYKIDESHNYLTKSSINNPENNGGGCTGLISSSNQHRQKSLLINEQNLDNSKEWYV